MLRLQVYHSYIYKEHKSKLIIYDVLSLLLTLIVFGLYYYFNISIKDIISKVATDIITVLAILIGFLFTGYFSVLSGQVGNRLYNYKDEITIHNNKKELVSALQRVSYYLKLFFNHSILLIVILIVLKSTPKIETIQGKMIFNILSFIALFLFLRTVIIFIFTYNLAFEILLNNRSNEK